MFLTDYKGIKNTDLASLKEHLEQKFLLTENILNFDTDDLNGIQFIGQNARTRCECD